MEDVVKLLSSLGLVLALILSSPVFAQDLPSSVVAGKQQFDEKVLVTGLEGPWEVTWGPDDFLWVTERTGGRIIRINPKDGTRTTAFQFKDFFAPGGQDGLL